MTFDAPNKRFGGSSSAPPPPPPSSTKKRTRNRKRLIVGISAAAVMTLGFGSVGIGLSANEEKLDEYEDAHSELTIAYNDSNALLEDADQLDPTKQEELEAQLTTVDSLLAADAPKRYSLSIDSRTGELVDAQESLADPTGALTAALNHRESYNTSLSSGEELLTDAEDLIESTADEVLDEDVHAALSEHVASLKEALDGKPDETSSEAFASRVTEIDDASENVTSGIDTVSESHEEWTKAKEEAAKTDPNNYETLSEREWQLIERSPSSHTGEKYVLYGAITQADSNTGMFSIRANTGPTQQSRMYDYDANTIVRTELGADSMDFFSDVVQDDHVKMLVEVEGTYSYDTTIGGSATAVEVTAYDLEVIGQF